MSKFTDLKATYTQLTGKQVPVGTSTAKLEEMVVQVAQKPPRKIKSDRTKASVVAHKESRSALEILKAKMAQVTQAQAMAEVLKVFPSITRKDFFHSAVEAGINIKTAKNYFDHHRKES